MMAGISAARTPKPEMMVRKALFAQDIVSDFTGRNIMDLLM